MSELLHGIEYLKQQITSTIGWNEIEMLFSIVGTIATIIAVRVAIRANNQTAEALRYSLEMQEQSKNLNLYENRMKTLLNLSEDRDVNIYEVELLFSNDDVIIENYRELLPLKAKKKKHDTILCTYENAMSRTDANGNLVPTPALSAIKAAEIIWQLNPQDEEKKKEFFDLCKKGMWATWNYAVLKAEKAPIDEQYFKQRKVVVNMMEEYIRCSIARIDKKTS